MLSSCDARFRFVDGVSALVDADIGIRGVSGCVDDASWRGAERGAGTGTSRSEGVNDTVSRLCGACESSACWEARVLLVGTPGVLEAERRGDAFINLVLVGVRGVFGARGVMIAPGKAGTSRFAGKLCSTSASSITFSAARRVVHQRVHRCAARLITWCPTRYTPSAHRQASSIHGSLRRIQGRTREKVTRDACVRRVHVP